MNTQVNREESLFDAAIQMPTPQERAAYLQSACAQDDALRHHVEELIRAHDDAGAFLDTPAVANELKSIPAAARTPSGPGGTTVVAVTEKPGDKIGRYKLLQVIGEGGCGVVYMAEQEEPVRRRVALKIIKLGMDTRRVVARFEAERQALAMMDHPNIAKVLDAGATETGRPFFVMELVRGIRVTGYCDQNNLSTEDRLKLFIQICRAIQHAHQKGIIHRDIKPSNILVTLHDGVPVPKVIDFGIAKATDQRLTDKTLFTEFQSFMGTPAYTSPEQAEMSGLDIDTRSDIYSLGVLLYELLTGKTPFDAEHLMRSGLDEMRRTIRESEPPRPSTRLSTMIDVELTATAKRHQAEPPRFISRIRGDLDWIVMTCLEKDRTRRFDTVSSLILDIERYLNNEPVFARSPSQLYRFQKMVRRNRAAFVGGAVATAALITGLITSTWMFFGEREARKDSVAAEEEQTRLYREAERARSSESQQRARAEAERRSALRTAYNSDMNLIPQAMAANNFGRVVDLLNRHRPEKAVGSGQWPVVSNQRKGEDSALLTTDHRPLTTDHRQWEWRYFWNQFQSDAAFALPRQSNSITTVAISSDGRFLASSGREGVLKLWDLFRRSEMATFQVGGFGRGFGGACFVFSPTSDRLAAPVGQGWGRSSVKVWALPTREIAADIAHEAGVQSLAFSSDGAKLLTVSQDFGQGMVLRVWDFAKQQFVQQTPVKLQEGGFGRRQPVFSSDARRLAVSEDGGVIRIIDVATGAETQSITAFEDGSVHALAFSPDGELLAATGFVNDTVIKLFKVETGAPFFELDGHASWVPGVAFSSDGQRLVSAGADQTVRIWDLKERKEWAALRGHLSEVNCVAITPEGKTIISGCKDGTLFGWDAQRTGRTKPFATLPVEVETIEFLPEGRGMLSVNTDFTVSLWGPETLQESERVSALGNRVTRLLVSPDGARLYAGTFEGEIKVLDWATRQIITNLAASPGTGFPNRGGPPWRGVSFGPVGLIDHGRTLVAAGPGSAIRLWDTESWQPKVTVDHDGPGADLGRGADGPPRESRPPRKPGPPPPEARAGADNASREPRAPRGPGERPPFRGPQMTQTILAPDERFLFSTGRDGAIEIRNLFNGQTEATLAAGNWGVAGMAFSPDGSLFATASAEGTVTLWNPSERKAIDVLRGHLLGVHAAAFSPDGQRIASGSHGSEAVKLWDVVTRQEVATLGGQGSMFSFVKFSPGGRMLVAINRQGLAHIWRAPSLAEIEGAEKALAAASP